MASQAEYSVRSKLVFYDTVTEQVGKMNDVGRCVTTLQSEYFDIFKMKNLRTEKGCTKADKDVRIRNNDVKVFQNIINQTMEPICIILGYTDFVPFFVLFYSIIF